jgi:hypothetical protein
VGFNRTGTKSLRVALRTLGYQIANLKRDAMHALMVDASRGDFSGAIETAAAFDGFADWPWPLIYRELDAAYPGSQFILTTRQTPQSWFSSLCRHAQQTGPTDRRRIAYGFANPWDDEAHHIRLYERHIREVEQFFRGRENQFLRVSWDSGDGWDALCGFLGHSVPGQEFPHFNSSAERGTDSG